MIVAVVKMTSEYWVISAPGDKTCQQTWDKLNNATKSGNLSVNYKFPIPDLKVWYFGIIYLSTNLYTISKTLNLKIFCDKLCYPIAIE